MIAKPNPITHIREFILTQFPLARRKKIEDNDALLDSGIIDSMGVLEVTTFLESEFEITLTEDEMVSDNFQSIATLAEFVQSKIGCAVVSPNSLA